VLQIFIQGKKVTPAPGTFSIKVGQKLTLAVTSDTKNELHVHGWDVERELVPNQMATVQLVGKEPGTYEVETHDPELLLTKVTVR
jgi:heme/copper-type cytochrome/quinol oxidase subunit 2